MKPIMLESDMILMCDGRPEYANRVRIGRAINYGQLTDIANELGYDEYWLRSSEPNKDLLPLHGSHVYILREYH